MDKRLRQIQSAFANVIASAKAGREFVAAQLEDLEVGSHEHSRLLKCLPEAIEVIATDDTRSDSEFLKLFLLPARKTIAVFFSRAHRDASDLLLARLQSTLSEPIEVRVPPNTKVVRKRRGVA